MKFLSYAAGLLFILSVLTTASSAQATFTNSTAVIINDAASQTSPGIANPYPSTINVSGLRGKISGAPGSVKVRFNNFTHPYSQDIAIVLVGPTGAAFLLQDYAGDDALNGVTYTLSDDAAGLLPLEGTWKDGAYKPTAYFSDVFPAPAPDGNYKTPSEEGASTFSSTYGGTDPNGTWKLFIGDFAPGDAGKVEGGWSLTITASGADAAGGGASVDMNGDGRTDFAVTRETSTPFNQSFNSDFLNTNRAKSFSERRRLQKAGNAAEADLPKYWYIKSDETNLYDVVQFGRAGDLEVPQDYDGDGKTDIAVWREGAPGETAFYILQSSDKTFRVERFGQTGDDPTVAGDYDGDKIADVATFRCPENAAGQCYFFYRGSLNNPKANTTYVPFGFGTDSDYYVSPGDFDGDGKYDFCLRRQVANGGGQFVLLRSSDFKAEYINWGLFDDYIVPGDYDGDRKADFMVVRPVNGQLQWFLQTRTGGGTGANAMLWGLNGDYMTPGDYDGDGKTDIAVWRPNSDPTQNYYYILRSGSQTFQAFEWGMNFDIPVQSWNIH